MKNLALLALFCCNSVISQNDSLKKIKFSGAQIELYGLTTFATNFLTKTDVYKVNNSDNLLNQSFAGYDSSSFFKHGRSSSYNGSFALRAYWDYNTSKIKHLNIYAGIGFGGMDIGSLRYYKNDLDTISVYTNSSNEKLYKIQSKYDEYYFGISASRVNILMGAVISSNKNKWFWFTAGAEISPGIIYNYRYHSSNYLNVNEYIASENTSFPNPAMYSGSIFQGEIYHQSKKINKNGFLCYAALPLTANLRMAKKVPFLKHLNLSLGVAPGLLYTNDNINTSQTRFSIVSSFGVRYNL